MVSSRSPTLLHRFLRNAAGAFCIFLLSNVLCSPSVRLQGKGEEAKQAMAIHDCTELRTAVKLYRLKHGRLPASLEAIADGFEYGEIPEDPWGNPYHYVVKAEGAFDIVSLGADGKPGGEGFDRDLLCGARARP